MSPAERGETAPAARSTSGCDCPDPRYRSGSSLGRERFFDGLEWLFPLRNRPPWTPSSILSVRNLQWLAALHALPAMQI